MHDANIHTFWGGGGRCCFRFLTQRSNLHSSYPPRFHFPTENRELLSLVVLNKVYIRVRRKKSQYGTKKEKKNWKNLAINSKQRWALTLTRRQRQSRTLLSQWQLRYRRRSHAKLWRLVHDTLAVIQNPACCWVPTTPHHRQVLFSIQSFTKLVCLHAISGISHCADKTLRNVTRFCPNKRILQW